MKFPYTSMSGVKITSSYSFHSTVKGTADSSRVTFVFHPRGGTRYLRERLHLTCVWRFSCILHLVPESCKCTLATTVIFMGGFKINKYCLSQIQILLIVFFLPPCIFTEIVFFISKASDMVVTKATLSELILSV